MKFLKEWEGIEAHILTEDLALGEGNLLLPTCQVKLGGCTDRGLMMGR